MYIKPGCAYCAEHTRQLGGLLPVGEETSDGRAESALRLAILGRVHVEILAAIEAAESIEVAGAITSLGIRIQNAILRKG